ncbi:hypothetical protein CRYUN_Cryun03dG0114600 [Craigia yunnanensis]
MMKHIVRLEEAEMSLTKRGPVELAAVGVSIALFNQVSRIAIFPLVSITTSFVAEEDTIGRVSSEAQESEYLEIGSCVNTENKDLNWFMHKSIYSLNTRILVLSYSDIQNLMKVSILAKNSRSSFDIAKFEPKRKHIPSASSALVIGGILGLLQAIFLISGAKPLLNFMGVSSDSPMLNSAQMYLKLRSLGAPAVLLSLAMQGVFRGFKDTKTPLYATVAGDITNIIWDPIFMFVFRLRVSGAAIAHVTSQQLISVILLWKLMSQVDLLRPNLKHLQFGRFLKNGFLLFIRVVAVTFCITLSASMAARQGSTSMAAFQVCLQIWLAISLLADGLAVAGQVRAAFVELLQPCGDDFMQYLQVHLQEKDYKKATATSSRVLQLGLVLELILAVILGGGLSFGAKLFTKDVNVLHLIGTGIPDRDRNRALDVSQELNVALPFWF